MKKFFKQFRYGQKGFTLIELLVVVAILGILAAVAVPNIGKFIGQGKTEAKSTELSNVLTAVTAAMAETRVADLVSDNVTHNFGNTGHLDKKPYSGTEFTISSTTVGTFISGGAVNVAGCYIIKADGSVVQDWYPGDE